MLYIPALAWMSCRTNGLLVTIPDPRGRKSLENEKGRGTSSIHINNLWSCLFSLIFLQCNTYLPTKFSNTELFPADCPPITAICGRSTGDCIPKLVNASCSPLTMGINCCISVLVVIVAVYWLTPSLSVRTERGRREESVQTRPHLEKSWAWQK